MKQKSAIHSVAKARTIHMALCLAARPFRFGRHLGMNALAAVAMLAAVAAPLTAAPMNAAFSYQGRLYDNGSAVSGNYDLQFTLLSGPNQVVSGCENPLTLRNVPVANGVFTVSLPFCVEAFDGADRWLQIAVSPPNESNFSILSAAQKITATPYAFHADTARVSEIATQAVTAIRALNLDATARVPWSSITDVPPTLGGTYAAGAGLALSGDTLSLDAASLSGTRYDDRFWKLGGNVSVASGMNQFGIMNDLPLDLVANSQRVLRLEPKSTSPNLIGGHGANLITPGGVVGGTIGGGGFYSILVDERNRVTDNFGSVGGGKQNQAGNNNGTINDASYATVSGGRGNSATGQSAAVGGGEFNTASGAFATVPGGAANVAAGSHSLAAGRGAQAAHAGSFVWADATDADYSSTADNQFSARAAGGIRLDGNVWTQDHDLRLRSFGDINHGVGFRWSLAGSVLDGPFLYGNLGGALGTRAGEAVALKWNDAGDVTVSHNLSTATLTIRGGADLAEPFKMSGKDIPQGAVVVIDEENPGQLKLSSRAYDTQVAGVISGANGVRPGIAMQQEGVLEGGQNVALTGRVYVQADATYGAIKPGDLLTTSPTPGHAMNGTDRAKAQGAILGKAMTALKEGRGVVLVLVTLQ